MKLNIFNIILNKTKIQKISPDLNNKNDLIKEHMKYENMAYENAKLDEQSRKIRR